VAHKRRASPRSRERSTAIVFDRYSVWVQAVKVLAERGGVSVVVATTNAREALAALAARRPDLFIFGLERTAVSPDVQDAFLRAASETAGLVTVVVGSDDDPEFVQQCLGSGADAYVLKTVDPEDLLAALRQAVDPSVYLFARPAGNGTAGARTSSASGRRGLTARELQVLRLVAEGLPNAEVARRLWISEPTVKYHLSRTYEKLGVSNRTGAVRWAERHGLLAGAPSAARA
jgi:DNA-binding NarL/FixJ family response regulator